MILMSSSFWGLNLKGIEGLLWSLLRCCGWVLDAVGGKWRVWTDGFVPLGENHLLRVHWQRTHDIEMDGRAVGS